MILSIPSTKNSRRWMAPTQIVGDFIEWLGMNGYTIANYPKRSDGTTSEELFWCGKSRDDLMAAFFEINRSKLENEKLHMLEQIRKESNK